ncbi:THO complex subunit 4C isoform X2 [Cryptomeria japonica]|nr:THO complex subunit 4C isoform X2 [Cryptomeria japonica]
MFENSMSALGMPAGPEAGAKLYISNLDFGVTNSDIKELFAEVGELKRCTVHYDRSGRSNGTAEVVYINMSDAVAAVKRYNNVQLDGKPMKLEIIGTNLTLPVSARVNFPGRGRKTVVMTPGFTRAAADASIERRSSNGWNRGRGTGSRRFRGRGRGRRGRGRSQGPEKSAAELDKELETYHTEAMQTS